MTDTEKMRFMEMENMRLMEENVKLRRVISKLNQTLNRLIEHYIRGVPRTPNNTHSYHYSGFSDLPVPSVEFSSTDGRDDLPAGSIPLFLRTRSQIV